MSKPRIVAPQAGQESVWDYPRPPRLEPTPRRIRAVLRGLTLADSTNAMRVLETSHPPTYYLPPSDVRMDLLVPADGGSFCEWKGRARYFDAVIDGEVVQRVAWCYSDPSPAFEEICNHLAFYLPILDDAFVDEERPEPQPGNFYGGWITSDLAGPFKGEPGSMGW